MKFKKYLEDFDKKLNEVSVATSAATHVGAKGDDIDTIFAGGFKPDEGDIRNLLLKQVYNNDMKRKFSDKVTPLFDRDYIDLDWKYEYDEYVKKDNSKFKSNSQTEMQLIDLEIDYDKVIDKTEENKKFINDTNDWKSIYDSKKY